MPCFDFLSPLILPKREIYVLSFWHYWIRRLCYTKRYSGRQERHLSKYRNPDTSVNKFKRDVFIHLFVVFLFLLFFLFTSIIIPLQLWMYQCMISEYTWYIKYFFTVKFPIAYLKHKKFFLKLFTSNTDCRHPIEKEIIPFEIVTQLFFSLSLDSLSRTASSLFVNQCLEFPPNCDALWVFNKKQEEEEVPRQWLYEESKKNNEWITIKRVEQFDSKAVRSVVVLAIKYTANNNKSDTWQEKYNDIITKTLHFCLSGEGGEDGGLFDTDDEMWGGITQTRRAEHNEMIWRRDVCSSCLFGAKCDFWNDGCLFFAVAALHIYGP